MGDWAKAGRKKKEIADTSIQMVDVTQLVLNCLKYIQEGGVKNNPEISVLDA